MPPRRFWTGSQGSRTPKRFAVSGISCIRPMAPLGDRARGSNPDSASITAITSLGSRSYSGARRCTHRSRRMREGEAFVGSPGTELEFAL